MEYRFDFSELKDLADAWKQAPEIVREELLRSVTAADLLVQREVQELTPRGVGASGGLVGSIQSSEQVLANNVIGIVGTSLAYAVPVELGTRPHRPPVLPIMDWVRAKLSVPEEDQERVAWAIAGKIAKQGTKGAFMFQKARDATATQVQEIMSFSIQRITDRLAAA